ncbi:hypothetical protein D8Y22_13505 [Salinadaptatus halalkaliphilus]|uniref:Uncharacterized protein n=2 Tax=Salinadaptatus halalkaliphilus TaxID=2419781 RepID=A0A4S3TPA4_9EURY|nr:hypothetical protein D8Y22_13505 [Salinadaptatus halalkaliphilus]
MLARDTRVILASLAALGVALAAALALESAFGVAVLDQPLLSFLLVAGLAVLAPQLYLAATDDDISPRTRVRVGVILLGLFALGFADPEPGRGLAVFGDLEALQHVLILVIGAGAFVALVCYEFVAGFRSRAITTETEST